jgi:hypothetical protein
VYRHALDRAQQGLPADASVLAELDLISHRGSSTGFFYQKDRTTDANGALAGYPLRNGTQELRMMALVEEVREDTLVARATNPIRTSDLLLTMNPAFGDGELVDFTLTVDGEVRELVRPTERFKLKTNGPALGGVGPYSLLLCRNQ